MSFEIQTLWGTLWLLGFLGLHSEFQPFKFVFINRLENISLVITLATFALGGYLGPSDSLRTTDSSMVQLVSVATVGINALFIGYSVIVMLYKGLSSLSIVKQFFNRILLCFGLDKCFPSYFKASWVSNAPVTVKSIMDDTQTNNAQIEITSKSF
jgi:uncharacterized membrane protein YjfL (UPF0719 family)